VTVSELIERLQREPPDARVLLLLGLNELANGKEVAGLEAVRAWRYGHREDYTKADCYEPDPEDAAVVEVVVNLLT